MKKNLLNESEIRKFMKFANLQPLTENFIDNNTTNLEEEVVEETSEEVVEEASEEVVEETPESLEEEILSEEDVDVKDLVTKLMQVITDETGVEVTVQDEGGADELGDLEGEPAEDELGDEVASDEIPPMGDEVESGEEVAPMPGEEEEADDLMLEMVEKVSRRVASRLLKESKTN